VFGWLPAGEHHTVALAAGFDAGGTLTLAWTRPRPARSGIEDLSDVEVASAGLGARLGAPQVLARGRQEVGRIALTVTPQGAALLGFVGNESVEVYERTPGSTPFVQSGASADSAHDVAVALDPAGAAVVAWRGETFVGRESRPREKVLARTRGAGAFGAAFGAQRVVDDYATSAGLGGFLATFTTGDGPPIDGSPPTLAAAVGPDGRAVVTWLRGDQDGPRAARGATIASDGTITARAFGSPCRRVFGVAALLVDGKPAIAFVDDRDTLSGLLPLAGGVVHLVGGDELLAARTPSPAPRAHVRPGATRPMRYGEKLAVAVVCDRACDLLVQAGPPDRVTRIPVAEAGGSAPAGAVRRIVVDPFSSTLVSRRAHGVPLRVTACAPDGTSATVTTAVQPATQVPARPGPVPRDVRARRSGRSIIVTWSIARPLPRIWFDVAATPVHPEQFDPKATVRVSGRLRTHFRVVLHPRHPETIERVIVLGHTDEPPYRGGAKDVRLT
jgi:hypothetical protein